MADMESTEQASHPPSDNKPKPMNGGHMTTLRREIAAQALKELWQELKLEKEPLIFASPVQRRVQLEHHALLLDQLAANGKQRKKIVFGQLKSWERLSAPEYAQGIAATGEVSMLLKADMLRQAEIGERGTIPAAPYGWVCYAFKNDWKALSVFFYDSDNSDFLTPPAIPHWRPDSWLALLTQLDPFPHTPFPPPPP